MCRPTYNQEVLYNGYYKGHGLKFQGIITPSGILYLYGPVEGRLSDAEMLYESGVLEEMEGNPGFKKRVLVREKEIFTPYYLYGDPAYPCREHIQAPFKGTVRRGEAIYNNAWARVRIVIEQAFGMVTSLWHSLNFKTQEKTYLVPVGQRYMVSVILTNIHTCIERSNIVSTYFGTDALVPDLDTYLQD